MRIATLAVLACALPASAAPLGYAHQLSHSINDSPWPSPDGKRMVYIVVVAGIEQLFVANLDMTKPVQITHDDYDHEDPAWSPDGNKIAFVAETKDGGEAIAIMDPDGTHVEVVTPKTQKVIHPNWSPDSKKLAYCTDDDLKPPAKNASDILVLDLATHRATKIISGGVNTYPAFSPDGKRLAFRKILGEMNSEVFIANADGTGARNLTNHPAFDGWPSWSPDGSLIAFASNRFSSYEIFVMKPDGSDVQLVANTDGRATAPQWSRDGQTLYFPICHNVALGADCQIYTAPSHPAK
ncbi:MAG TPA: LpqB family beta-propeller domain-containing protein [Kofleriaceae bacterium]|jgi:TolB protein|nr:LpqB family beta-propeller domain-containing protein [Kofleriaceae bacterium]